MSAHWAGSQRLLPGETFGGYWVLNIGKTQAKPCSHPRFGPDPYQGLTPKAS